MQNQTLKHPKKTCRERQTKIKGRGGGPSRRSSWVSAAQSSSAHRGGSSRWRGRRSARSRGSTPPPAVAQPSPTLSLPLAGTARLAPSTGERRSRGSSTSFRGSPTRESCVTVGQRRAPSFGCSSASSRRGPRWGLSRRCRCRHSRRRRGY
jgi:hypothetical protein